MYVLDQWKDTNDTIKDIVGIPRILFILNNKLKKQKTVKVM